MNIEKSFTFQFEDKDWLSKLGLGAVILLVPVLNFAWTGYTVQVVRNVMAGVQPPMPTWDDLGKKFMDGLMLTLAWLVYMLPLMVVICIPLALVVFSSGLVSEGGSMQDIGETIMSAGGVLLFCLLCVFLLYALTLSVIYPAILVLYAREGTFNSCFKFREAFDLISRNSSDFLTAWGVNLLAGLVLSTVVGLLGGVLSFIPCLGSLASMVISMISMVYLTTIQAHLFGQFGARAFSGQSNLVVSAP
jgi:hypothetical protein